MAKTNKAPELRFAGYTDDWKEKDFSNEVEFFSGLTYSPIDVVKEDGTFVIRSSNIQDGKFVDADNVYVKSSKVNCEFVKKNDIAVVVRNGSRDLIGKHAQIKRNVENTVVGAFMTGIRSETPNFINALLDSEQFKKEINKNLGATINQITTGNFKQMKFWFPDDKVEKQNIGNFFENLDKLITEHQQKHGKLKALKQAMLDKMFPKQGELVPEIRFKGFEGDWEEYDFNKTFINISNNSLSREKLNYDGGKAKNVHYGDILVKFGEILDVQLEELPFITDNATVIKLKNNLLNDGDIIFSDAAEDETVGKCVEILNLNNEKILSGLHTIAVRPKQKFAPRYLGYYLNSNSYHNQLLRLMQGTKVLSISKTAIKNTKILFPRANEEQLRIGNYFKNLDQLINNHETQIIKLQNIKKAFLAKMFI